MRLKAYIALLLVILMYSGNILVGKAINELPPFTIALGRLTVAFIILTPIGFPQAIKDKNLYLQYKLPLLIMTLTGVTFFSSFVYSALQFTSSTNVSILETIIPALAVILSVLFLKEKITLVQWLGVIISFVGAIWVVANGNLSFFIKHAPNKGDIIMVVAIIFWAIYSLYVKQYMYNFRIFGIIWLMTGISVIILLPIVMVEWWITGIPNIFQAGKLAGIFYLGIFPSFIALILYSRSVIILGAGKASVMLNLLPVFTMLGAYFLLNEHISFSQILGSIIVISGVTMTIRIN
ncbi:MAG: DMT family transporter [Deferribacterota bacterium]|nr:DMT family transporter [Deferribacterota bacterium]